MTNPSTPGRGPLGTATNSPKIDLGTSIRNRVSGPSDRRVLVDTNDKRDKYLSIARATSYAMQGKSAGQGALSWMEGVIGQVREFAGGEKSKSPPRRVQSFLGGAFLRMYLDGQTDPATIIKAGEEIGKSEEFAELTAKLKTHLQSQIDKKNLKSIPKAELAKAADSYLDARKNKQGIAFKRTLNTVIGGVTNVDVEKVVLVSETPFAGGMNRKYQIGIIFYDDYDFNNKRSGEFEAYRVRLAELLLNNKFDEFEQAFTNEASPIGNHSTKLDNAAVFAAFMYALERKGWTPGSLSWKVTVPADVELHFAHP